MPSTALGARQGSGRQLLLFDENLGVWPRARSPQPRATGGFGTRSKVYGHTVVELLLVTPIVALLSIIFIQFLLSSSDGLATIYAQHTLQSNLSRALQEVLEDARQASTFVVPGGSCAPAAFTAGASTLCVRVPSIDSQGQLLADGLTDMFVYNFNAAAGTLERTIQKDPGSARANETARVIARDLTSVTFTITTSGATPNQLADVTCALTGRRVERGRQHTEQLTSRTRLRNYRQ